MLIIHAVLCAVSIMKITSVYHFILTCNTDMHVTRYSHKMFQHMWECKHILCVHYHLACIVATTHTSFELAKGGSELAGIFNYTYLSYTFLFWEY